MSEIYENILKEIAELHGFEINNKKYDITKCGFLYDILLNGETLGSIKVWFRVGSLTPRLTEISFKATEVVKKEIFKDYYIRQFNGNEKYKDCLNKLFEELSV